MSKEAPDLNASRLAQSELDEHAASAKAQPIIAKARYIMMNCPTRATVRRSAPLQGYGRRHAGATFRAPNQLYH